MGVLVAEKVKQFVFDDWAAHSAAGGIAMEFGIFLVGGNIGVGLEKEGRSVQPIRSAMDVSAARYGDAVLCITAALELAAPLTPVLFTTRAEATWLVLLPLKRLLASTPLSRKLLLVSRCPLAQMDWFPSLVLPHVPLGSSAFTPGERIARLVKLPVASGTEEISSFSRMYPLVVSWESINGVASTVTVEPTAPTFRLAFRVAVRSACTTMEGMTSVSNPSCVKVSEYAPMGRLTKS